MHFYKIMHNIYIYVYNVRKFQTKKIRNMEIWNYCNVIHVTVKSATHTK